MNHETTLAPNARTPEKDVESRVSGGAWSHTVFCFRELRVVWLLLAVWNSVSILSSPPYGWLSWLGFLLTGGVSLYFLWTTLPGVAYQRLLWAKVWAKWNAVRRWVACLRFFKRYGIAPLPEMHLDGFVAKALAAEGQLNEAVAILNKYKNDETVPQSLLHGELGSVYEKARLFDKMIEHRAHAVAASTGSAAEHIDYALGLARYLRNPQQARVILASITDKEMTDLAAVYVSYCWGLIALEEGKYEDAKTHMLSAFQQATPYTTNILMLEFFMDLKAHLVIIFAKLGEKQHARQFFNEVKRFLIAHQEVDLLQRCREVGEEL